MSHSKLSIAAVAGSLQPRPACPHPSRSGLCLPLLSWTAPFLFQPEAEGGYGIPSHSHHDTTLLFCSHPRRPSPGTQDSTSFSGASLSLKITC